MLLVGIVEGGRCFGFMVAVCVNGVNCVSFPTVNIVVNPDSYLIELVLLFSVSVRYSFRPIA